ncbi:histone H2B-like [Scyliorhinus torazame]|uniref:histone H2B-like n=1 Tax=Scyliorhinus torazame TaxID=75743 RepID=UPI003B5977D3
MCLQFAPTKKGTKKAQKKTPTKGDKKRKSRSHSISTYKVTKQVHSEIGISSQGHGHHELVDQRHFRAYRRQVSHLAHYHKRSTISSLEIQPTARLLPLPGELAKHAVSGGPKAGTKDTSSK